MIRPSAPSISRRLLSSIAPSFVLAVSTAIAACADPPPNPVVPRLDAPAQATQNGGATASTSDSPTTAHKKPAATTLDTPDLPKLAQTPDASTPVETAPTVTGVIDVPEKLATALIKVTMPPGRTQPRYAPCDKPTCLCPRALSATSTPYAYIELRNPNPEPVRAVLFADSGKADMPLVVAHYASPQVPDRDKREGCFGSVTFGAAPNTMTSSDEIQIPASKSVAVLIQSQFPNAPSGLTVTVKRLD